MTTRIYPVVGLTFVPAYPSNIRSLTSTWRDEPLAAQLVRNPANEHDTNAIEVHVPELGPLSMIGHIGRDHAARIAPLIDRGDAFDTWIYQVRINPAHRDRPGIDVALRAVAEDETSQPTDGPDPGKEKSPMAFAADTGTTTGAPFAKFTEIGDTLVGALGSDIGKSRRQRRNYKTREPEFKADGRTPSLEEILHLIVMPGTTAKVGSAESGYNALEPGTHVRYAVSGFKWGQVIEARKALPAAFGFGAGVSCSGDVYTIRLVGWSASTENAKAAEAAGFTVVDGRIVLRTEDDRDKYVLARTRQGANANTGADFEFMVRRRNEDEKAWEQRADELFMAKPWEQAAAAVDEPGAPTPAEWNEEPF